MVAIRPTTIAIAASGGRRRAGARPPWPRPGSGRRSGASGLDLEKETENLVLINQYPSLVNHHVYYI